MSTADSTASVVPLDDVLEPPTVDPKPNHAFAAGLRTLADLIDTHPCAAHAYDDHRHLIFVNDRGEMTDVIRELGGTWQKTVTGPDDDYFGLTRDLGGGVTIYVYTMRGQVCERVQVGTRTVMKAAPEAVVPMVEVEEPVFEWRCAPSLLSGPDTLEEIREAVATDQPRLSDGLVESALELAGRPDPEVTPAEDEAWAERERERGWRESQS